MEKPRRETGSMQCWRVDEDGSTAIERRVAELESALRQIAEHGGMDVNAHNMRLIAQRVVFSIKDCRIEGARSGAMIAYYKATHLPTGIVVEQSGPISEGRKARQRLIEKLQRAVEKTATT